MGVRTIRKGGKIVGYQAIAGAGGVGQSRYFAISQHGAESALKQVQAAAAAMQRSRPARTYPARGRNAKGVPGLRLEWQPSKAPDGLPVLYAVASWQHRGHNRQTKYSTQVHGMLGAVELAAKRRQQGTGQCLGLTTRQLLNRMKLAL